MGVFARAWVSYLAPGLSLLVPLSTNPLLLGSFSPTLLLKTKHTEMNRGGKTHVFDSEHVPLVLGRVHDLPLKFTPSKWKLDFMTAKISQFFLWVQWAPLLPSSCTQSGHRSGTAARSGLCFGVSSGCPVTVRHTEHFTMLFTPQS